MRTQKQPERQEKRDGGRPGGKSDHHPSSVLGLASPRLAWPAALSSFLSFSTCRPLLSSNTTTTARLFRRFSSGHIGRAHNHRRPALTFPLDPLALAGARIWNARDFCFAIESPPDLTPARHLRCFSLSPASPPALLHRRRRHPCAEPPSIILLPDCRVAVCWAALLASGKSRVCVVVRSRLDDRDSIIIDLGSRSRHSSLLRAVHSRPTGRLRRDNTHHSVLESLAVAHLDTQVPNHGRCGQTVRFPFRCLLQTTQFPRRNVSSHP